MRVDQSKTSRRLLPDLLKYFEVLLEVSRFVFLLDFEGNLAIESNINCD